MSFTSMHNDYLDPDKHNFTAEDYESEIFNEMKRQSSGRWQWNRIHLCWSGKDGDLDEGGHQGVELIEAYDDYIVIIVHAYKTVVGTDICLNLPEGLSGEMIDKCHDLYQEQMELTVMGAGSMGEWDGDDWILTYTSKPIKVNVIPNNSKKTVRNIIKVAQKELKNWEREMKLVDQTANVLSGWRYINGHHCKEGKPCKQSVYTMVTSDPAKELEKA